MESRVIIEICIEEVKISLTTGSPIILQVAIDSKIKEYSPPYKDIYFNISKKSPFPKVNLSFISENLAAEGVYSITNLKVSEKIRVQITTDKGIIGFVVLKFFCIENPREILCKHCDLLEEIIIHSSKSAIKLGENIYKPIDYDLGLELNLLYLENKPILTLNDSKFLKTLLIGAHEKIKTYEIIMSLRLPAQETVKSTRKSKIIDYSKIISALEQKISRQNSTIEQLHGEHKSLADLLLKEKGKNKVIVEELETIQLEFNIFKGEIVKNRTNKRGAENVAGTLDDLALQKSQSELELAKLKDSYKKSLAEFADLAKTYDQTIAKLLEEKENLEISKEKSTDQIKTLSMKNDALGSTIAMLKSEISKKTVKIEAFEDYYKESPAEKIIKENIESLYERIESNKVKAAEFAKLMRKDKTEMMGKNTNLLEEIKELRKKLEISELDVKRKDIILEENNARIATLKNKLQWDKEAKNTFLQISDMKTQSSETEKALMKQVDFLLKFTLDLSQKFLFQQRLITKMFKFTQDKDCEICILRNKITDEQSGLNIYIPDKSDNIDVAMADYVNTRPNFLEVPFVRVEKGVYLFGSKIVKVKLQNNRLIMCLGGGFMSIDEFITIFTPPELEKMIERKKYDLASEMKANVNDSLSFLSSDGPMSPIESPVIRRPKKELTVQSTNNSFKGLSRDNSIILTGNPISRQAPRRSMTRKDSLAPKF